MDETMFQEAFDKLDAYVSGLQMLSQLQATDNFKYLTRVERDVIYKTLLDNLGALEDVTKALVKAAREVRRVRLRDDDQLSRMVVAMTNAGLRVTDYENPSATASLYANDESGEPKREPGWNGPMIVDGEPVTP